MPGGMALNVYGQGQGGDVAGLLFEMDSQGEGSSAQGIKKVEVIAFEDLGPEAVRRLTVADLPAIVINDAQGRDLYQLVAGRR